MDCFQEVNLNDSAVFWVLEEDLAVIGAAEVVMTN